MYNVGQIRAWSLPHLKTGCWYIDCGKGFCPEEELDLKASIDAKETGPRSHQSDDQAIQLDEDVADLTILSEKDKKKEDAKKGKERKKKEKEGERSKGKGKGKRADVKAGKKTVGSSKKSKDAVVSESEETASDDSLGNNRVALSTGSLKRDAAFAGLSISRMQLDVTGKLRDCVRDAFNVDEFFFKGSFLSVEDHYVKVGEYPSKWLELKAFIEKV